MHTTDFFVDGKLLILPIGETFYNLLYLLTMLFADGAPNLYDSLGDVILGLQSSYDGLSLACVGLKSITLWRMVENSWIKTGRCSNQAFVRRK